MKMRENQKNYHRSDRNSQNKIHRLTHKDSKPTQSPHETTNSQTFHIQPPIPPNLNFESLLRAKQNLLDLEESESIFNHHLQSLPHDLGHLIQILSNLHHLFFQN